MDLAVEPGSIDQLSQVIGHVVGPSFLLGAVAGFISLLLSNRTQALERFRRIKALPAEEGRSGPMPELALLRRRMMLLHKALLLALGSGIAASILIIAAFGSAMLGLQHAWGAAILFMVSMTLLCASLVYFAFEVRLSMASWEEF
jgi:hypothetical protein